MNNTNYDFSEEIDLNNNLPQDFFIFNKNLSDEPKYEENELIKTEIFGAAKLQRPVPFPPDYWFVLFILIYITKREAYRCTGSLLKPKWVLTSGNCIANERVYARNVVVVAHRGNLNVYLKYRMSASIEKEFNSYILQERRVVYYRVHPHFDRVKSVHDVALLKLRNKFTLPVKFGLLSLQKRAKKFENCTIVGFGILPKTEYGAFNAKFSKIKNLTVSRGTFGCPTPVIKKIGSYLCFEIKIKQFCKGDLGSPLLCDNEIWGISTSISKHRIFIYDSSCYGDGENYFNDLYPDLKWINSIISKGSINPSVKKQIYLSFLFFLLIFRAY